MAAFVQSEDKRTALSVDAITFIQAQPVVRSAYEERTEQAEWQVIIQTGEEAVTAKSGLTEDAALKYVEALAKKVAASTVHLITPKEVAEKRTMRVGLIN